MMATNSPGEVAGVFSKVAGPVRVSRQILPSLRAGGDDRVFAGYRFGKGGSLCGGLFFWASRACSRMGRNGASGS